MDPSFDHLPSRRRMLTLAAGLAGGGWSAPWARRRPPGPTLPAAVGAAPMIVRPIPHSGDGLPAVGLGTADVFDVDDDPAGRKACAAVIETLVSGGGKLIDTAPSYGTAESVVGDLVAAAGLRGRVFLATKLETYDRSTGPAELRASLQRLRTGRVDLMQLHNVGDPNQDLAMLRDWQAQGLCRYVGITTSFDGDFDAVEAVLRRQKPDFVQVDYSLADRGAEERVIPAAADIGAAVLTDLPYARNRLFRAVRNQQLPPWAAEFGAASWGQFFLKYLLGNPAVTAVIPGTSSPAHMADNLAAGRGPLPDATQRRQMVAFFEALR
jgi:aryl-alcohol dehydrogenase-like predicted oxidoreductase